MKRKLFSSFTSRLLLIVLPSIISLTFTISLPFILGVSLQQSVLQSRWLVIILVVFVLLVVPLVIAWSVISSISMPHLLGISWRRRVVLVIAGFLSMILTYTGTYFYLAASGDYNQAVSSNIDFNLRVYPSGVDWQHMTRDDLLRTLRDRREFKGMNHHIFLAIHEDPENIFGRERELLEAQEILRLAQDEKQLAPRLDSTATWGLLGDCFHFSVTTAATVGYGDISPATSFTRFVTDTQILSSVAILVFGLGFVMNNREDTPS